jgi:hypothetical protein
MDRVMTNQSNHMVWDFIYPLVVTALGVAAGAAIFLQITGT